MPALSQHAEVMALDRRAAGRSETPSTGYTFGGTADAEVPFAEAVRLQDGLPQAVLVPFEDGGHRIRVTHAEAYAQAVTSFLHRMG